MHIDPDEYTDDESKAPAGGGRAETSPMAMTPDRPSQAASAGVPADKARGFVERLRRAIFVDKDPDATDENLDSLEELFETADLSGLVERGKQLITPAGPAEPITKRDLPRSPVPKQGSPVPTLDRQESTSTVFGQCFSAALVDRKTRRAGSCIDVVLRNTRTGLVSLSGPG